MAVSLKDATQTLRNYCAGLDVNKANSIRMAHEDAKGAIDRSQGVGALEEAHVGRYDVARAALDLESGIAAMTEILAELKQTAGDKALKIARSTR